MKIAPVESDQQLAQVRELFGEYFEWVRVDLGIDLGYQGVQAELAALPGYYAPPGGRLLLALDGAEPAGCVALRPMEEGACELKRMYIRPQYRGRGLGRAIGQAVIAEARQIGYRLMRLDTADFLTVPRSLYTSLGFREVAPYYDAPQDIGMTVIFMEMPLGRE